MVRTEEPAVQDIALQILKRLLNCDWYRKGGLGGLVLGGGSVLRLRRRELVLC